MGLDKESLMKKREAELAERERKAQEIDYLVELEDINLGIDVHKKSEDKFNMYTKSYLN